MHLEDLELSPKTFQAIKDSSQTLEMLTCHPFNHPHPSLSPQIILEAHRAIHRFATRASSLPISRPLIETYSRAFDKFVGLPVNTVIQLCGRPLSGKTLMCVNIAASVLRAGDDVIWIDTSAGVWQIRTAVNMLSSVDHLQIRSVSSGIEAIDVLRDIVSKINPLPHQRKPRLLVFDSPASLLAPLLGLKRSKGHSGHSTMQRVTNLINRFTTLCGACTVVTNRTVDNGMKPALGNAWACFADMRLFLKRAETIEERLEVRVNVESKCSPVEAFAVMFDNMKMIDNDVEETQQDQELL